MVVGVFPLGKLLYLGMKQISKPIANQMKAAAKRSTIFKQFVCMPPAQVYNWLQMNVKMRVMGSTGKVQVTRLNEETAVELGAELIGEFVIYTVASAGIVAEYYRSSKKEQERQSFQDKSLEELQSKVKYLELNVEQQAAQLREVNRLVQSMRGTQTGNKTDSKTPSDQMKK